MHDQFAFTSIGSTNYALIDCIDQVTGILETNNYARCFLIDFSNDFDMVNLAVVIRKLNLVGIPQSRRKLGYCFFNWTISDNYSCFGKEYINRSLVQGFGIGPSLYILKESDLHPIFKLANDTNLHVPEQSNATVQEEFAYSRMGKMK